MTNAKVTPTHSSIIDITINKQFISTSDQMTIAIDKPEPEHNKHCIT